MPQVWPVPAGMVVCEHIEDYYTPEEEAAMFAKEVRTTHECYTLEEAVELHAKLGRYIEAEQAK
jgi:hypothetical protein